MMFLIFLFGFFTFALTQDYTNKQRVIGGSRAQPGEIPYIVSLKLGGGHICGGSILNQNHVLTAAHCVFGGTASSYQIQYGVIDITSTNNRIQVKDIKIHENYVPSGNYPNDIAILTLSKNIKLNKNVSAIVLPKSPLNFSGDNVPATLSGWGYNNDNGPVQRYLLTTNLPLFRDSICEHYLDPDYDPDYHVCAGGLDGNHKQCSGDSGGPLYGTGAQQGIVSWSYKPCTSTDKPGVFTKVANYVQWIQTWMAVN